MPYFSNLLTLKQDNDARLSGKITGDILDSFIEYIDTYMEIRTMQEMKNRTEKDLVDSDFEIRVQTLMVLLRDLNNLLDRKS